LQPDDVDVQAVYGRVDESDELHEPTRLPLHVVDQVDGQWRYEGTLPLDRTGPFGYTVRVLPRAGVVGPKDDPSTSAAELGLVAMVGS
jgi:starch phosphorylase